MTRCKRSQIKCLLILSLVIYFLYGLHARFFRPSSCSHLYSVNSFQTCALSSKACNISILVDSYLAFRNCIIESAPSQADYVVFDAVNGLGNRVLGFIAVTAYALITDRVLLIHWRPGDNHPAHFEDLFVPLSQMDNKLPWYSQYSFARLAAVFRNRWMNEIEWQKKSNHIPRDSAFYFDRQILCNEDTDDDRSWFVRMKFAVLNLFIDHVKWIRTDQYFMPLLTRNERRRESFPKLFPDGQIFAQLARRLLRPIPKVQSIVKDFQSKYDFSKINITIGVHMRSWSSNTIDHTEPFQKCIEHVMHNITLFATNNFTIHLYVISNTPKRRQQLESQILKTHPNVEILHAVEAPRNASALETMQHTLAELCILSQMQHLIVTSRSTFGMVAQGLARRGAWIVKQGAPQELPSSRSDLCEWESSSEPEYQLMGSISPNEQCAQGGAMVPSIGERTVM